MGSYETSDRFGLPQFTSTSVGATGSTNVVSAPGAGNALAIDSIRIFISTDTAGENDTFLRASSLTALSVTASSSNAMFRTLYSQTQTTLALDTQLSEPWILDTNTALVFALTISAASTPGAQVEVRYRILTR